MTSAERSPHKTFLYWHFTAFTQRGNLFFSNSLDFQRVLTFRSCHFICSQELGFKSDDVPVRTWWKQRLQVETKTTESCTVKYPGNIDLNTSKVWRQWQNNWSFLLDVFAKDNILEEVFPNHNDKDVQSTKKRKNLISLSDCWKGLETSHPGYTIPFKANRQLSNAFHC